MRIGVGAKIPQQHEGFFLRSVLDGDTGGGGLVGDKDFRPQNYLISAVRPDNPPVLAGDGFL
jgi:hypothetical protein